MSDLPALDQAVLSKDLAEDWPAHQAIESHRTAIARSALSRPLALALNDGILRLASTLFDYGCGQARDIRQLKALGYEAEGWDPVHRPRAELRASDVVNLGYVVNVIDRPDERVEALKSAWALTKSVLVVAARTDWDTARAGHPHGDGVLTGKRTFQKFYKQEELRAWIDGVLGVPCLGAPQVFARMTE